MKILMILECMRVDGGVETSTASVANELAKIGHEVYIATMRGMGPLVTRLNIQDDNIVDLGKHKTIVGKLWELNKFIKKNDVDIVHTFLYKSGVVGRLAAFMNNRATVATEQSTFFPAWRWYHYAIDGFLAKRTHCLTAVSNSVAASLAARTRVFPYNIEVINNSVDRNLFWVNKQKTSKTLKKKKILFVGRLEVVKNIDLVIEIAKKLKRRNFLFEMEIYGEGSLADYYLYKVNESGVGEYVKLMGKTTNIPEVMRNADVFLTTSYWEGCPMVIIEAFASGLPVVARKTQGIIDVVDDCTTGLIFDGNDAGEAADKIVEISDNHKLRNEIVNNAIRKADEYCPEKIAQKMLMCYALAMSRKGSRKLNVNLHTAITHSQAYLKNEANLSKS